MWGSIPVSWVHHGEGSAAGADPSHWGGLLPHRGVAQGWCVVSTLGSCTELEQLHAGTGARLVLHL